MEKGERMKERMNERIIVQDQDGHWYLIPYASAREFNKWVYYMEDLDEEWEGTDFDTYRIDYPGKVIILDYLMEY